VAGPDKIFISSLQTKFTMPVSYYQKFLVAIVFIPGERPKKYKHGIKDRQHTIDKFCNDMRQKWPAAQYVNFYDKRTQVFKERVYL